MDHETRMGIMNIYLMGSNVGKRRERQEGLRKIRERMEEEYQ